MIKGKDGHCQVSGPNLGRQGAECRETEVIEGTPAMRFLPPHIRWYDWRTYRAMYRSRGAWWPSMGALACLALFLMSAAGDPFIRVVTTIWLGTLVLAYVLFGVALVGAVVRGPRAIVRMGARGWTRPRWWFEWANLAWSLAVLIVLVGGPFCALAPKLGLGAWGNAIWRFGVPAGVALFWVFMGTAAMGYVVSTLAGRPRIGNAYACAQFAFPVFGGTALVTIASMNWPAGGAWPAWPVMLLGAFGGAIMILGVWDLMRIVDRARTRARRYPGDFTHRTGR